MPNNPLVNKKYLLEKFQVRAGWTYAALTEVLHNTATSPMLFLCL